MSQIMDLSGAWSLEFNGASIHFPPGSILRVRGQDLLLATVTLPTLVEAEVRMLQTDKIETIRHVRARLGCTLSLAKDIVDHHREA